MTTSIDFKAMANAIGDAIVVCDAAGLITYWNAGATRIFGFSQDEALGASLDIIIPERMRKRHWDGYHKSMETGTTRYGNDVLRVPAINKAGDPLSISFTVAMLHGADGKVNAIASVMRDETARFNADRALRKRLQALESHVQGIATASLDAAPEAAQPSGCPVAHHS